MKTIQLLHCTSVVVSKFLVYNWLKRRRLYMLSQTVFWALQHAPPSCQITLVFKRLYVHNHSVPHLLFSQHISGLLALNILFLWAEFNCPVPPSFCCNCFLNCLKFSNGFMIIWKLTMVSLNCTGLCESQSLYLTDISFPLTSSQAILCAF